VAGPTLRTARLKLRPAMAGDADLLRDHWNRPEVRRFLWDDEPVAAETVDAALAQSDADFARAGHGLWIVETLDIVSETAFVGFCGLRVVEGTDLVEVLYSLEPSQWGKGFATEAAGAALDYAFESLRLPRVVGGVDPPNRASHRVLERLGVAYFDTLVLEGKPAEYYEVTAASRPAPST